MSPNQTPATETPEQPLLISTAQAAAMLTVSPMTLGQWRRSGVGPAYIRLATRVFRYRLTDVADFISRGVANPSAKVVAAACGAGVTASASEASEVGDGVEGSTPTE